jgi:hypothetical protein
MVWETVENLKKTGTVFVLEKNINAVFWAILRRDDKLPRFKYIKFISSLVTIRILFRLFSGLTNQPRKRSKFVSKSRKGRP